MANENDTWHKEEIQRFRQAGELEPALLLSRLSQHYSKDIEGEKTRNLAANLATLCADTPDNLFTEASLAKWIHAHVAPRSADSARAMPALEAVIPLLYRSIRYLSTCPFTAELAAAEEGITLDGMLRVLAWALPDAFPMIKGCASRWRSPADHRRVLFQSLATPVSADTNDGRLSGYPFDETRWRQDAARRAGEFPPDVLDRWSHILEEAVRVIRDDAGDEVVYDTVDLLYTTQRERPAYMAEVPWPAFRHAAKELVDSRGVPALHKYVLEAEDLAKLIRGLVPLLGYPSYTNWQLPYEGMSDACVDALVTAFEAGGPRPGSGANYEMFDRVCGKGAPALLRPYYSLLGKLLEPFPQQEDEDEQAACFLDQRPEGGILTSARLAQIRTFAFDYAAEPLDELELLSLDLRSGSSQSQADEDAKKKKLAELLRDSHQGTILLVRGRGVSSSWDEPLLTFGFYNCRSAAEDMLSIADPCEHDEEFVPATLFQLGPVHDAFSGVIGKPGWRVLADGGEVVFGDVSCGVSLSLDLARNRATLRHAVTDEGGRDGDEDATVFRPSKWRGSWEVEVAVEMLELWWQTHMTW